MDSLKAIVYTAVQRIAFLRAGLQPQLTSEAARQPPKVQRHWSSAEGAGCPISVRISASAADKRQSGNCETSCECRQGRDSQSERNKAGLQHALGREAKGSAHRVQRGAAPARALFPASQPA